MKLIGLLGGMSPESTVIYYEKINKAVNTQLGRYHSANIVMISVNFNEIMEAIFENRWHDAAQILVKEASKLECAGVDFMAICCNTLHKVLPEIKKEISTPFLHILEPTGQLIKKNDLKKIGLMGTRFTMEEDFHKRYLVDNYNIEFVIPDESQRKLIEEIIFDDLCHGIIKNKSMNALLNIVGSLKERGAEGVILACTELPLLFPSGQEIGLPIFNTTDLHAKAIAHYALNQSLSEI